MTVLLGWGGTTCLSHVSTMREARLRTYDGASTALHLHFLCGGGTGVVETQPLPAKAYTHSMPFSLALSFTPFLSPSLSPSLSSLSLSHSLSLSLLSSLFLSLSFTLPLLSLSDCPPTSYTKDWYSDRVRQLRHHVGPFLTHFSAQSHHPLAV